MRNILLFAALSGLVVSCFLDTTGKGPDDPEPIGLQGGSNQGPDEGYYTDGKEPMSGCYGRDYIQVHMPDGNIYWQEIPILCDPYWDYKGDPDPMNTVKDPVEEDPLDDLQIDPGENQVDEVFEGK